MAIAELEFGKNLRPSTVETMNKLNEVIKAVNDLDGSEIENIKSDIATLKTNVANDSTRITANAGKISSLETTTSSHSTDIDAIKITLYTPLSSTE